MGEAKLRPFKPGEFVKNSDGSVSTERTVTITDAAGNFVNVPSLWIGPNGNVIDLGEREDWIATALQQYEGGKPVFPRFKTVDEAVSAAKARSDGGGGSQGLLSGILSGQMGGGLLAEPPQRGLLSKWAR